MSDSEIVPGGLPPAPPNSYNPIMAQDVIPGQVVAASAAADDTAVLANNTAAATRQLLGVVLSVGDTGQRVGVRYAGPLTLTAAEWDAVITGESGGLTLNTWYYASAATPGKLTAVATANAAVGFALSPLTLFISLKQTPPTS